MKEDLKKTSTFVTVKRRAIWPNGGDLKKKPFGMKEDIQKRAADIADTNERSLLS
jgi:hypothetical protein